MCSTCELAVLGERSSSSAISALVSPPAIRRATSNSRTVSGRHGSSSVPRLLTNLAELIRPAEQGRAAQAIGRIAPDVGEDWRRLAVTVRPHQDGTRSSRAEVASQVRGSASQPFAALRARPVP